MIECTELIAVDLFNAQARRIQLGDVEQYLARLRNIPVLIPQCPQRPSARCATPRPLPGMLSTPTRTEVAAKNHRLAVRFFWCFLIGATTLSLVGNIAHAVLPYLPLVVIQIGAAAVPPIALLAAVHGIAHRLANHGRLRAQDGLTYFRTSMVNWL